MQKSRYSLCLTMLVTLFLLFTACRKNPLPPPGYANSQIRQVQMDSEDSALFQYNALGNPLSITRGIVSTGAPNYFFRYDAQHRLTDYYGAYSGGRVFEFWHRYIYDSNNHIATDTMYLFGLVGDNGPLPDPQAPPPYDQLYAGNISTYQYDAQHRIIRATDTYGSDPFGPIHASRYIYGANGNLAVVRTYDPYTSDSTDLNMGGYDNKINLHRTHPIWQFLDRDFSLNNHENVVTAYNAKGLPLTIQASGGEIGSGFISINYSYTLQITYQPCK
jgi:hypothetical protein